MGYACEVIADSVSVADAVAMAELVTESSQRKARLLAERAEVVR